MLHLPDRVREDHDAAVQGIRPVGPQGVHQGDLPQPWCSR